MLDRYVYNKTVVTRFVTTVFVLLLIDEIVILLTPCDLVRGVCAIYDRRNVSKPTYKLYYVKSASDILPETT